MSLVNRVRSAVDKAPAVDLHTHLFPPQFGNLNLWGIDELLTYHYLIAETLRARPSLTPEDFLDRPKADQADLVWQSLFVRNTPLSEATSGIVTVLTAFGLDPMAQDLREARAFFAARESHTQVDDVLRLAGVSLVTMTNDPLDRIERPFWDSSQTRDPRFHAVLRMDRILNDWLNAGLTLVHMGYDVDANLGTLAKREVSRFLGDWTDQMDARYLAVSLPDTYQYPDSSLRTKLLREVVLPFCRERDLPLAMMIGVKRAVNLRLQAAGDGMGVADLSALERLAYEHPENRFLVTTLAKENAHGLCVLARKFSNILPFGCWWFMNNPSLVEDTTLMRLEMLGPTFVPQHSDARILEQLIYKWRHARRAVSAALTKRYEALEESGRPVLDEEIERDANALMGGIAADWLGVHR